MTSANALAKSATERVDLGRATARLDLVKKDFTSKLIASPSKAEAERNKFKVTLLTENVLCDVRAHNVDVAARRNYLQSITEKIQEIGKPAKIDDLGSALTSLFANQSLDIKAALPSPEELTASKKQIESRCKGDLQDYDTAFYGQDIRTVVAPARAGGIFAAIIGLIDIIKSIITPVVVEGAKIADETARRNAVLKFLQNSDNKEKIKNSGRMLATEISSFTWDKRLRLAGATAEKAAVLRGAEIDLSKNDNCKNFLSAGKPTDASGKLTDDFILCWRGAWKQVESPTADFLKTADEYDQLADAGDTDNARNAFEKLSEKLDDMGKLNNEAIAELWTFATRLIGFAQKLETAFSKENREKIEKAIDALAKA